MLLKEEKEVEQSVNLLARFNRRGIVLYPPHAIHAVLMVLLATHHIVTMYPCVCTANSDNTSPSAVWFCLRRTDADPCFGKPLISVHPGSTRHLVEVNIISRNRHTPSKVGQCAVE